MSLPSSVSVRRTFTAIDLFNLDFLSLRFIIQSIHNMVRTCPHPRYLLEWPPPPFSISDNKGLSLSPSRHCCWWRRRRWHIYGREGGRGGAEQNKAASGKHETCGGKREPKFCVARYICRYKKPSSCRSLLGGSWGEPSRKAL